MTSPRIKICCIGSPEEARMAIEAGASAIGLVSEMPSGPGVIPEELITAIAGEIPPGVDTFLLTSKRDALEIIDQQRRTGTNTLQLVDAVSDETYRILHTELRGIRIVQVIHVINEESVQEALHASQFVDALLLDSGNPKASVKELGGTGRVHNWEISRAIRERSAKPVFLAGGLNPENIRKAIDAVHPYGVDVCSGVRNNGTLDLTKLQAFMSAAR